MITSHGLRMAVQGAILPTVSYINRYTNTTNLTSYTFSNCDIGTASSTRLVVVVVHAGAGTAVTVSSLTIGGVSATGYQNNAAGNHCSIWALPVSTGTTATVALTFSAGVVNCMVAIHAIYDLSSNTPTSSDSEVQVLSTLSQTNTLSVQNNGIVITGCTNNENNTGTLTGVTERYDVIVENDMRIGGNGVMTSTNSSYSVTVNATPTSGTITLTSAHWR